MYYFCVMGTKELAQKYTRALLEIKNKQEVLAITYSENHIALVNNRLEKDGEDHTGKKFPGYSDKPLPLFYFKGKSNRATAYDKFEKKVKSGKVKSSYREWRKENGLPTDRRTHVFTGDMLAAQRGVIQVTPAGISTVIIQAPDKFNQNKVEWNSNKMNSPILKASEEERKKLIEAYKFDLFKIIQGA